MIFDGVMMTKYFRDKDDNDVPDGFPWKSWSEFETDMEQELERMKTEGVRLGKLEVTPEGWLKGHGHPDNWFDAVCKKED
jgi:hypothetical protein